MQVGKVNTEEERVGFDLYGAVAAEAGICVLNEAGCDGLVKRSP